MFNRNEFSAQFPREQVLGQLRTNRAVHDLALAAMRDKYKVAATAELKKMLVSVENGKVVKPHMKTQPPKSFLKNYDEVISMLEMSTDEKITLNMDTFNAWMNDQWEWKTDYAMSNAAYLTDPDNNVDEE